MQNEQYQVYYLGHSAWAIETRRHYLLFDCQNENAVPGGTLSEGFADPEQLVDKPAYVFYSHRHPDHYSRKLHKLTEEYAHVYTVLGGFETAITKNTAVIYPHQKGEYGYVTVHTAASTDEGVCFLVEVESLCFFFAGDNADWGDGDDLNSLYYQEIDYIAGLGKKVDAAFIPVCTFSGARPKDMTKGAFYAIDTLKPAVTYPMHANRREHLYEDFKREFLASGRCADIRCAVLPSGLDHKRQAARP